MNKREQSIFNIMCAALTLFRENGFRDTNVRQIAERAEISLGMVNHYFGSKEALGAQLLSLLDTYAVGSLKGHLSFPADPILYDLVSVRVLFEFMSTHGYWSFYFALFQIHALHDGKDGNSQKGGGAFPHYPL